MTTAKKYRSLLQHPDGEVRDEVIRHLIADYDLEPRNVELASLLESAARTDSNASVRKVAIEWIRDSAVVVEIGKRDPDPAVRMRAAELTKDQTLLEHQVEHDDDPEVRLHAVWRIDDNAYLFRTASNHPDPEVRDAAVRHLEIHAPEFLNRVSPDASPELRARAIRSIKDTATLLNIARNDPAPVVRTHAIREWVKRSGDAADQRTLEEFAREADWQLRWTIVPRLTNQETLYSIALRCPDETLCFSIADKQLTSPHLLQKLVRESTSAQTRATAARRITDQSVLTELAKTDPEPRVRVAALDHLQSIDTLTAIAMTDDDSDVRWSAVWKLGRIESPDAVTALRSLLDQAPSGNVRAEALDRLGDDRLTARLATADPDPSVRREAIDLLNDQQTFTTAAIDDSDVGVAMYALAKVRNTADLRRVAASSRHADVRYAAEAREKPALLVSLPPVHRARRLAYPCHHFIYAFVFGPGDSPAEIDNRIHRYINERERGWIEGGKRPVEADWLANIVWDGHPGGDRTVAVTWNERGFGVAAFRVPDIDYSNRVVRVSLSYKGVQVAEVRNEPFHAKEVVEHGAELERAYFSVQPHGVHGPPLARIRFLMRGLLRYTIFASYAREDRAVVELVESITNSLKAVDFRWDLKILHSGDDWTEVLRGEIRKADAFQLFWSCNASRSGNVEREWRYALSLNRRNFILPVCWEADAPPLPPELGHLHSQRITITRP